MARLMQMILSAVGPRLLGRFDQQCRDPMETQRRLLQHIVDSNADTAFGKAHGFSDIRSIGAFKQHVPIQGYADHEPYIQRMLDGASGQLTREDPVFYATTSGTTGASKFIPVTPESRAAKSNLVRLTIAAIHRAHPTALSGRILSVVSPEVESVAPSGVPCGAESGHAYRNMPSALAASYSCPYEVFEIKDYDAKYYTLLRLAAAQNVTLLFSCNPSTVLLLAQRLGDHTEDIVRDVRDGRLRRDLDLPPATRALVEKGLHPDPARAAELDMAARRGGGRLLPSQVWPLLSAVACWKGGTVGMYVDRFDEYLPLETPVHDIGYLSSEHRGSLPLSDASDAGVLTVPTNFFEFHPADTPADPGPLDLLTADELEEGRRYFLYVTTLGGLYRYDMNDIVEVAGFHERTPMIRFIQKGKGVVSFTGEKLYESQVLGAVREAFRDVTAPFEFIAAVGELVGERPRYTFLVEFDDPPAEAEARALADRLEAQLRDANAEYPGKRDSGRIGPGVLRVVKPGEFQRYRQRMVEKGRIDAQFKVLRLTADASFAAEFEAHCDFEADASRAG